jgi:hypothetical protein
MVINGEYVLTDDDLRDRRMRALFACEEAQKNLDRLIAEAKMVSEKFRKVGKLLATLEVETPNPLSSEAQLLALPKMEYEEALNLETVKALANSIALARKARADALDIKQRLE